MLYGSPMNFLLTRQSVRIATLIAALCSACSDPAPCGDADGDGICDSDDLCFGNDLVGDSDNDGVCNDIDTCEGQVEDDTDGDGVCDDIDICFGNDALGDTDGDGVCLDLDLCTGDDATGDTDGDGVCDDIDICTGNNALGDTDDDGVCLDLDLCTGDDATGDTDVDGICDDIDLCTGDDATGDIDGDGVCNDLDSYDVAYLNEFTGRIAGDGLSINGVLAVVNEGNDFLNLANVSVVSASDDHDTAVFGCAVTSVGTLLEPGNSQGDLFTPIEALLVGQGLPVTETHTNAGLKLLYSLNSFPAGDFNLNGSCVLNIDGVEVTIEVLFHRIDSGASVGYDSVTRHSFY